MNARGGRVTRTGGWVSGVDLMFQTEAGGDIVSPRRLVAGDNSVDRVGSVLQELGVPTGLVFFMFDPILGELGITERVTGPLRSAGYESHGWGDVAGEPDLKVLEAVAQEVRAQQHVAVVALGGGSAMDPAKMAAAFATNDGPVERYLDGSRIEKETLPMVLIPTTAGTGAEASKNSIVTANGRKIIISNRHLCPQVALLDPTLTVTSPPSVTAASGLDALAHAVEATLSTFGSPFTSLNALSAIRAIAQWLKPAYEDGAHLPARRAMLYGAYLAGLSINAVVVLGHTMAYTIATRTHLPHGVTTAMTLPYCIAYNLPAVEDRIRAIEAEMPGADLSLARWVKRLCDDLNMPASLEAIGLERDDLEGMVTDCLERYPRPNNPRPFERELLLDLYNYFYVGDLDGAIDAMSAA